MPGTASRTQKTTTRTRITHRPALRHDIDKTTKRGRKAQTLRLDKLSARLA